MKFRTFFLLVLALSVVAGLAQGSAFTYTILGSSSDPGSPLFWGADINNKGVTVFSMTDGQYVYGPGQVRVNDGVTTSVVADVMYMGNSQAVSINNNNVVVYTSWVDTGVSPGEKYLYTADLPGGTITQVASIPQAMRPLDNNDNNVIAYEQNSSTILLLDSNGVPFDSVGGSLCCSLALNNHNELAYSTYGAHVYKYSGGVNTLVYSTGPGSAYPDAAIVDMNDSGQVVFTDQNRLYLWDGSVAHVLVDSTMFPGLQYLLNPVINNNGDVAFRAITATTSGIYIWTSSGVISVIQTGDLLGGLPYDGNASVWSMNDSRQVVFGFGFYAVRADAAVPEPATALLIAVLLPGLVFSRSVVRRLKGR